MLELPEAPFAGDEGHQTAAVTAALAAYAADPDAGFLPLVATLQTSRLLVPVVAVLGEIEYDEHGRPHEKTSDMAAVLLTGADGRTALLGFTCTDTQNAWDPASRPVAVHFQQSAQAALQDGADALVIDVAGPTMVAIEGDVLKNLAVGHRLVRVGSDWAWQVETGADVQSGD